MPIPRRTALVHDSSRRIVARLIAACLALGGFHTIGCASNDRARSLHTARFTSDRIDAASLPPALEAHRGSMQVLVFWTTWCDPCKLVMPTAQALHERYAPYQDIIVLGVHVDDTGEPERMLRELNFTYATIERGQEVALTYDIFAVPQVVVVDPAGAVIFRQSGAAGTLYQNIINAIEH